MVLRVIFIFFFFLVAHEGIRARIISEQDAHIANSSQIDLPFSDNIDYINVNHLNLDWNHMELGENYITNETRKPN